MKLLALTLFPLSLYAQTTINVKDYGAKGNATQDDTVSFEKAISNLNDGDTLYIPAGRYVLGKNSSDGIKISNKSSLVIKGDGLKSQLLYYYSSYSNSSSKKVGSALAIQNSKNIKIRDLNIMGMSDIPSPSFSYSSSTSGIYLDSVEDIKIENVGVSRMSGQGIFVTSTNKQKPSKNVFIEASRLNLNRVAGVMAANVDTITVNASEMNSNGQIGDAGTGYGFAGSSLSWSGYPANITLTDNEAFRNIRKGLDFHSGVNISVINNSVSENGLYGIDVEGPGIGGQVTIQGNHIHNMGASVTKEFQILNDNHPIVKANYTAQICAICIFYMKKGSSSLPDKSFLVKDNIIENISKYSGSEDFETYGVFAFAIANFDGANRDTQISFSIVGNRVVNSDVSALFMQGWTGDKSEGRFDFKFNGNYIEFSHNISFNQIYFFDAKSVEATNNTFHFENKYVMELDPNQGTTNEQRISEVHYSRHLSSLLGIDSSSLKTLAQSPDKLFAYYPGWKMPTINVSGNKITFLKAIF